MPEVQVAPAAQAWPHVPQFARSVAVFEQALPQTTSPAGQGPQAPEMQDCPVAQAWPHEPQFAGSVAVFEQALPQTTSPAGQVQVPELQTAPAGQA